MRFFEPLTDDHLRDAVVPLPSKAHTSPRWTDEEIWLLQLQYGCKHDRHNPQAGATVDPSIIASNDHVTIHVDKVSVSPVAMVLSLRLCIVSPPEGSDGIRGAWPWAVSTPLGSVREGMFYLAGRPGDICRFGARYSNDAQAQTGTGFRDNWFVMGEDDTGSYCSPELRMVFAGHSASPEEVSVNLLLYPAPPNGLVELFVEWPEVDLPESSFTLAPGLLDSASGCSLPISESETAEIRRNLARLRSVD